MTTYKGVKKSLARPMLAAAALVGLLAFAATPRVYADDYGRCQKRIIKADHKVHEAIEHHGWNSRQADHARYELQEARERCWNEYHRWWDEDGHRWHTDRDWDDHDHDHDRH
jgi:dienelactone hydrolase